MIQKIFIVAGHGRGGNHQNDPGAIAIDGTTERQIAVSLSKKVEALFPQSKISTIGVYQSTTLIDKIRQVNEICELENLSEKSAFLISIHCDFRGASEGVAVYHERKNEESKDAAEIIMSAVAEETGRKRKWNKPDSSSPRGSLGILTRTTPLAVLLEAGTLRADGNQDDGLELLKSEKGQKKIALGIGKGLEAVTGVKMKSKEVSPWAKESVEKAIKAGVATNWDDPQEIIANVTAEHIFKNAGIFGEVTGDGISKERFIVALDRGGLL